jgi:hypothetical protein
MNNKKIDREEKKREVSEKELLDNILKENSSNLNSLTREAESLLPKKQQQLFDLERVTKEARKEAKDIVESNARFYLTAEMIHSETYVRQKMRADIATMDDLMLQSKIAEYAIISMIRQIEDGIQHPRQFEVLAGFQRSKLEITKTIAQFVVIMETNYKNIRTDFATKNNLDTENIDMDEQITEEGTTYIARGTKDLVRTIRGVVDSQSKNLSHEQDME